MQNGAPPPFRPAGPQAPPPAASALRGPTGRQAWRAGGPGLPIRGVSGYRPAGRFSLSAFEGRHVAAASSAPRFSLRSDIPWTAKPRLLYPATRRWALGLFPVWGHDRQDCDEHIFSFLWSKGAGVKSWVRVRWPLRGPAKQLPRGVPSFRSAASGVGSPGGCSALSAFGVIRPHLRARPRA